MREKARVGIGRLVLNTRERICAVEPRDHRMLLTTLRTHEDIITATDVGGMTDVPKPNRRMLDIAETIIEQHAGTFDPSSFKDRYEDAVRDLIARKQRGRKVTTSPPVAQAGGHVIDLMDALRRSLAGQNSGPKDRAKRLLERTKGKPAAKGRPTRKTSAA
jgi:DNA end-binding protein Ku